MCKIITNVEDLMSPSEPLTFLTDEGAKTEEGLEIISKIKEIMASDESIIALSAPQIGINKKIFTILANDLEGKTWLLAVINPKIIKKSKDVVYLPAGEGCLSVDRETCGITPRYKRITVEVPGKKSFQELAF